MSLTTIEPRQGEKIFPLSFSDDSSCLYTSSFDPRSQQGSVQIWNSVTGELQEIINVNQCSLISSSTYSEDYVIVAVVNNIRLLDLKNKKVLWDIELPKKFSSIACTRQFIATAYGEDLSLYYIDRPQTAIKLKGVEFWSSIRNNKVIFSQNERFVVLLNDDRIGIWDLENGYKKLSHTIYTGGQYLYTDMVVSPDSSKLIWIDYTPGGDTEASSIACVAVHDILNDTEISRWHLKSDHNAIRSVDISSDGCTILAGGSFDKSNTVDEVCIWGIDAPSGDISIDSTFKKLAGVSKEHSVRLTFFSKDVRKIVCCYVRSEKVDILNSGFSKTYEF